MNLSFFGRPKSTTDGSQHGEGSSELATQLRDLQRQLSETQRMLALEQQARREAEERVRELEQQQQIILSTFPDIFWYKNRDGEYLLASNAFYDFHGYTPEHVVGKTVTDLFTSTFAERINHGDQITFSTGKRYNSGETAIVDREGKQRWVETIRTPVFNEQGELIGLTGISRDITNRKIAEESLRERAEYLHNQALLDPLTGTWNRRALEQHSAELAAHPTANQRQIGVLLIDLDHFKRINDTYGHATGDGALCILASYLTHNIPHTDRVFRYGGEEFLIILHDTAPNDLLALAENLRAGIASLVVFHQRELVKLAASFGVAHSQQHGSNLPLLITNADTALYRAKHSGRNRVVVG
jgi:diguanylate cyclase (GGDEF)-like protein/PAS domain S-box-containing protein